MLAAKSFVTVPEVFGNDRGIAYLAFDLRVEGVFSLLFPNSCSFSVSKFSLRIGFIKWHKQLAVLHFV